MALVTHTLVIECADQAELEEAYLRLALDPQIVGVVEDGLTLTMLMDTYEQSIN